MRTGRFARAAAWVLAVSLMFSGCGTSAPAKVSAEVPSVRYEIPPFRGAAFHETDAADCGCARIDLTDAGEGYIALTADSEHALKFQVECADGKYNYNVPGDGSDVILPLNMGNGAYSLRLLENVEGSKYACLWEDTLSVEIEDAFDPFVRPSQMVPYGEGSQCAELARSLAGECAADSDVVSAVYGYLVENISYDREKAESVQSGYLPDPDRTLEEKKGICFDYASLAAAMLRSVGIPCKLITGYLDGEVYHAWNSFYLQEQGWVTVEIKAKPGLWQRVDITMAASGKSASELEDDSKYTARFVY